MPAVIAALVAATVATFGYVITARSRLLEDRRRTYAAALGTVRAYQGLPHRIRRRPDSEATTRGALGTLISDLQRDMDHYWMLLKVDSEELGRAYYALVVKSRQKGKTYRDHAWQQPPASTDDEMSYPEHYSVDDNVQISLCLDLMRKQLRLLPWPGR
jgi:hypothetical protein